MTEFQLHKIEDAEGPRKAVLEDAKARYGFVPNLIAGLAEAPPAASAYMDIGAALAGSSLAPEELHVVWFALNTYHGCDYCMAAHTTIAKNQKIPEEVIETARAGGAYDDSRLETLRAFALKLADQRGWVEPSEVDAFIAAGFTKANVIEIILAITHKVLSNYTNHVVGTPLDAAFAPNAWAPPAKAAE